MADSLVPPETRALVGKVVARQEGTVERKEAQRFAAAVGDLNPLYFDEAAARAQGHPGLLAPPMFLPHVMLDVARLDALREDGVPRDAGGEVKLGADRLMAGGEEYEFLEPLRVGDTLTAETRIASIEEKSGRSGPFVLLTRETTYTNQEGRLVAKGRFSVIAR